MPLLVSGPSPPEERSPNSWYAASIFEHNERGRIFDRDFTIAALAFLCSRLLGATKRGRAAAAIQRAYRQNRARRIIRQRMVLLKIAYDCKAVFDTRNKVIGAATRLQRAWRDYKTRRPDNKVITPRKLTQGAKSGVENDLDENEDENVDIWLS